MLKRIKSQFTRVARHSKTLSSLVDKPTFFLDPESGMKRRHYATYEEYLSHQAEKLDKAGKAIKQSDQEYEELVATRYEKRFDWGGKSILCLGARLGGEVRAFKSLGALAVGIDIEPGPENRHVLHGDFHEILFPAHCFDFAFTNAVDHVFDLDRFVSEVDRVLKNDGIFLVELAQVKPGSYEVLDTSSLAPILKSFSRSFELVDQEPVVNQTEYINWEGQLLQLRKSA